MKPRQEGWLMKEIQSASEQTKKWPEWKQQAIKDDYKRRSTKFSESDEKATPDIKASK